MKICNNCGWYNQDSATSCVKCQDTSFKPIADAPSENESPVSNIDAGTSAGNPVMSTVAFNSEGPMLSRQSSKQNKYAATVLDADAVLQSGREQNCRKCRYPIVGNVDYCPNCGATIKSDVESVSERPSVDKDSAPVSSLKATVRDISECMKGDDVFRLVPIDAPGESAYEMNLGDVISIRGCRYRFQK